jgi:hypothetical protein
MARAHGFAHVEFYSEVLGGTVVLKENPDIVKLANSWIIMNPGSPPTVHRRTSLKDTKPGSAP